MKLPEHNALFCSLQSVIAATVNEQQTPKVTEPLLTECSRPRI